MNRKTGKTKKQKNEKKEVVREKYHGLGNLFHNYNNRVTDVQKINFTAV